MVSLVHTVTACAYIVAWLACVWVLLTWTFKKVYHWWLGLAFTSVLGNALIGYLLVINQIDLGFDVLNLWMRPAQAILALFVPFQLWQVRQLLGRSVGEH